MAYVLVSKNPDNPNKFSIVKAIKNSETPRNGDTIFLKELNETIAYLVVDINRHYDVRWCEETIIVHAEYIRSFEDDDLSLESEE